MVDEYKVLIGKVLLYEGKVRINNLENVLNENAQLGFELVSLHQHIFDGLQFSLVMKRTIQ